MQAEAQDRPGLFGGQFDCGDVLGCVAPPKFGPSVRGAKIAHPIDNAVGRNQVVIVGSGEHDERDVHRSASLAAANRQYGERSDPDASADERSHHCVVGSHEQADSIRFRHRLVRSGFDDDAIDRRVGGNGELLHGTLRALLEEVLRRRRL